MILTLLLLTLPGPGRGSEHEEKGARNFLPDEREFGVPKPKFSPQTLQVCALPGNVHHIKREQPSDHPPKTEMSPMGVTPVPAASGLMGFDSKPIPALGSFNVLFIIYVLNPCLFFYLYLI